MRFKMAGDRADTEYRIAMNEDATLAGNIPAGTPVILAMNGTDDGFAVVLPSTAGAAQTEALLFGVCPSIMPYNINKKLDVICNGVCNNALLTVATRSASSASWSSSAAITGSWQALVVDTVNNAFATNSTSVGASRYQAFAVLCQSVGSVVASASATTDTRTAILQAVKIWVNLM